ncbi:hypothetical protein [Methanococcoides alaskense]|uniref:DUF11 domain-containing protein n=1 Tax=Methanococcoides alaskense TaxID=325778 RepID=A0AA90ZBI1_9EURY|nr:hypothetical protein [Methanococcoides alaskense]MDA0525161.1 hypothetical protein [Methanococcoides alaskense]MDR6221918.1 hypothetical protein [Methanococcoides alaskense]
MKRVHIPIIIGITLFLILYVFIVPCYAASGFDTNNSFSDIILLLFLIIVAGVSLLVFIYKSMDKKSSYLVTDEVENIQNAEPTFKSIENNRNVKNKLKPFVRSDANEIQNENESINIATKSAFHYKGATIIYKVKTENNTPEPIADLQISLFVPDVFLLENKQKTISMLEANESKTVTFEIRPTGECGDCHVSGKVNYYDYSMKKRNEIDLETKSLSIVCPLLHSKSIAETEWRSSLTNFAKAEETTKEIDIPASTLFDVTSDVLQDMNLFMLEPKVNDSANLYRVVAKFYGEGVKELRYAAQIEVVGGSKKSKLILKAWAEAEEALTGFYHGILDEIEKRIHVKGLIDSNIVYNYHYGDTIGTQITDSLVQRSNIGNPTPDYEE